MTEHLREPKHADEMTPGVNFIKVLRTAFTLVDPGRVKRY